MKTILRMLPHLTLILSVLFIVFLILDQFNPTMDFVNNEISEKMLWVLCISAIVNTIVLIVRDRRTDEKPTREEESE